MATPSGDEISQLPELFISPAAQYPLEPTDSDSDIPDIHPSRTPSNASSDFPLLPDGQTKTPRSHTVSPNFVSSPLNPNATVQSSGPPFPFVGTRAQSRQSIIFNRIASEESQALASQRSSLTPNRASMILYRLVDENEKSLSPPTMNRQSILSNSGESTFTVSYDSKYPSGPHTSHKLIPYPFDPSSHINTPEDDDALHDPTDDTPLHTSYRIPLRGFINIGVLILVISALLCLFIFYPVWHYAIQRNNTVP